MIQGFRTASLILLAASIAGPAFAQGPGADVYKTASPKCGMCHSHAAEVGSTRNKPRLCFANRMRKAARLSHP
jgi:hypothetical protein